MKKLILLIMIFFYANLFSFQISQKIFILNPSQIHDFWLKAGKTYTLRWETYGNIEKVNIKFSLNGGKDFIEIANNVENTGRFKWKIPENLHTDKGIILIENSENSKIYGISEVFHILNGDYSKLIFNLKVNTYTPENDIIFICFNSPENPIKMKKISLNQWYAETNDILLGSEIEYRYARNGACSSADEYFENIEIGWRKVTVNQSLITLHDNVKKWRWLPEDGRFPEIDYTDYLTKSPENIYNKNFIAGIMFTDWWSHQWLYSVNSSLSHIKKETNANWIEYSPVAEIVQYYPYPIIDIEGNNATSLEDLRKIIDKIHQHGFKVYLNPFAWPLTVSDNSSFHSDEWWIYFLETWGKVLLTYAKIAQEKNVELFGFRMWPGHYFAEENINMVNSIAKKLLTKIRKIYKGKIAIGYDNIPGNIDMDIFYEGDYLSLTLWSFFPWKLATSKDSNSNEIYNNLINHFDNEIKNLSKKYKKKIIFEQLAASSYYGDKIGQPNFEIVSAYFKNDPSIPFDFKGQADTYEAYLRAISEKDFIAGVFSFGYFYWDAVDKTPSIRKKPAEKIVAKWYKWIKGENNILEPIIAFPNSLKSYPINYNVDGNFIEIPAEKNVLFQPILQLDDEDNDKYADLIIYIVSNNNSFSPILLTQKNVDLNGKEIKFNYFKEPIDFSNLSGLSFKIYFGYKLSNGKIKYNFYNVNVN